MKKVVITGPESTGKTELAKALAQHCKADWIPEYSRSYIENLDRPYTFDDVEAIAKQQVLIEKEFSVKNSNSLLIFDTWLIITKVWFDVVYQKCPQWIIDYIRASEIDLFLVCNTDIAWKADNVRENGGEKREQLFRQYCTEIENFGFKYQIVSGLGAERLTNALKILKDNNIE